MTVIRIQSINRRPPSWEAWPDGQAELRVTGDSLFEVVGKLVYMYPKLFDTEVLGPHTPAGQMPVR